MRCLLCSQSLRIEIQTCTQRDVSPPAISDDLDTANIPKCRNSKITSQVGPVVISGSGRDAHASPFESRLARPVSTTEAEASNHDDFTFVLPPSIGFLKGQAFSKAKRGLCFAEGEGRGLRVLGAHAKRRASGPLLVAG